MSWQEYVEKASEIKNGYVVAALTDEYIVDTWPMENSSFQGKEARILEVRVFNKDKEVKLLRPDISTDFYFRDSDSLRGKDTFTETQYLDIDTVLSEKLPGKTVVTTGGGKYFLPIESISNAKIDIEYYVDCDEKSGQARVCDWRLVGFEEGQK